MLVPHEGSLKRETYAHKQAKTTKNDNQEVEAGPTDKDETAMED